jgi:hypothetical protein
MVHISIGKSEEKCVAFCGSITKFFPVMGGESDIVQSVGKMSSMALERLWEDKQFSIRANNLIVDCMESLPKVFMRDGPNIAVHSLSSSAQLSKDLPKAFDKDFTNYSATRNEMMDIKFPLFKKSFRALQKEAIDTFEKEFDERLAFTIGKEKATRLRHSKKHHQLAFFRWIFSLCTIASLPCVDDDEAKSAGSLFS